MLLGDHPGLRRRALAARLAVMATSLELAREGSRELAPEVDYPRRVTPNGLRRWAADLEAANRARPEEGRYGQGR